MAHLLYDPGELAAARTIAVLIPATLSRGGSVVRPCRAVSDMGALLILNNKRLYEDIYAFFEGEAWDSPDAVTLA